LNASRNLIGANSVLCLLVWYEVVSTATFYLTDLYGWSDSVELLLW